MREGQTYCKSQLTSGEDKEPPKKPPPSRVPPPPDSPPVKRPPRPEKDPIQPPPDPHREPIEEPPKPPRRKRTGNHEVERVSPARAARSAASCPISAPIMNTIDV